MKKEIAQPFKKEKLVQQADLPPVVKPPFTDPVLCINEYKLAPTPTITPYMCMQINMLIFNLLLPGSNPPNSEEFEAWMIRHDVKEQFVKAPAPTQ